MDFVALLAPEGVPLWAIILVIFASYFTAALTATFGLGGGLALLAVMSALLPPAAVVPVHGVAQLGSNFSRFALQRKDVDWTIVGWFSLGAALGAFLGAQVYVALPEALLKAAVGAFVLFTVWGPKLKAYAPGPRTFFATGAVGSFLTMFFGATGPIAATMLSTTTLRRLAVVATHAACMVVQHGLKSLAFGALGFAFHDWAIATALVVAAGFLGSWSGVAALRRMPEEAFRRGFKTVLTLVALYLLMTAAADALRTG